MCANEHLNFESPRMKQQKKNPNLFKFSGCEKYWQLIADEEDRSQATGTITLYHHTSRKWVSNAMTYIECSDSIERHRSGFIFFFSFLFCYMLILGLWPMHTFVASIESIDIFELDYNYGKQVGMG